MSAQDSFQRRVHELVARIPRGRVLTYGSIAAALGAPGAARSVGWAMHQCPESYPWHRVVNAKGQPALRPGARHHAFG